MRKEHTGYDTGYYLGGWYSYSGIHIYGRIAGSLIDNGGIGDANYNYLWNYIFWHLFCMVKKEFFGIPKVKEEIL